MKEAARGTRKGVQTKAAKSFRVEHQKITVVVDLIQQSIKVCIFGRII